MLTPHHLSEPPTTLERNPKMPTKRLNKITLAFADEDIAALDEARKLDPVFPPDRAELLVVCARDAVARLLRGESRLQDVYDKYGVSPVRVNEV
jgi:hypothetical protein